LASDMPPCILVYLLKSLAVRRVPGPLSTISIPRPLYDDTLRNNEHGKTKWKVKRKWWSVPGEASSRENVAISSLASLTGHHYTMTTTSHHTH